MLPIELVLQIQSTGKQLKREVTDKSAKQWQKYWCRRLLRYKNTSPAVKEAIAAGDVIVGWSNFDECCRHCAATTELQEAIRFCSVPMERMGYHKVLSSNGSKRLGEESGVSDSSFVISCRQRPSR